VGGDSGKEGQISSLFPVRKEIIGYLGKLTWKDYGGTWERWWWGDWISLHERGTGYVIRKDGDEVFPTGGGFILWMK